MATSRRAVFGAAFVAVLAREGTASASGPSRNADAVVENFLPMNSTAAPIPPNARINNMGNFCGAFTFYDAASLPRPTWLTLTEIPRERSVETFARLALECQQDFVHDGDQGENGAFRAAWALLHSNT